jgi:hypothetical protein
VAEIRVNATGALKLYDNDDSHFVGLQAGSISSDDGDSLGTASAEWSDLYLADGGIVYFGNDQDIRLTHNADKGLILKHSATADDKPVILTLQTGETDMAANDVIGKIEFQAPDEGTGTDAVLVSAAVQAVAEGDHSSSSNATSLQFMTGASEAATAKMYVKSDGKVGIGEGTPLGTLHVYAGNSTATGVQSNSTALVIEGAANCGLQFLSTNDEMNTINFGDPDDANPGVIQYNHNSNNMHFTTNAVECIRINAGASTEINPGAVAHGGTGFFIYGASGQTVAQLKHADTSGSDTLILFKDGANTNCGSITIDTSNNTVAYATSSDYRLKENETAITDGITRLKQLKPYRFNWKSNSGGNKEDGFFAHEVQSIVPEAISGTKDETETVKNVVLDSSGNIIKEEITEDAWKKDKEDGIYASDTTWSAEKKNIIKPQSMDYGKITPLLAAALKEAITKIETLETKVAALEG